jgi:transposase
MNSVWGLGQTAGKIVLHPLPPYCPKNNKIERVWEDLHAEVTRNHTCPDIDALMAEVRDYLQRRNQQALNRPNAANNAPPEGS